MHLIQRHNDTNEGDDEMQENSDDDESEEIDALLQEDSM